MMYSAYKLIKQGHNLENGGVEGCALIFTCEDSKTTTRCWTSISWRMLDPTKKNIYIKIFYINL